jgi:hypothetical protein
MMYNPSMEMQMKTAKAAASKAAPKATKGTVAPRAGVPKAVDPAMQRWLNKWAGILTPEGSVRLAKMARAKK